ncbi:MAG: hypothetical protein EOR04_13675 [Mesorhizobium sp.]|uniref:hypothetical protein n=1 Tax=Mesorhizobium sp. TaxID=1871066 RepID=UPI000FE7295B|nr:hypothetical protein [Mesorhizobium sp.]RWP41780.1 MAG: hypothetical protein EOR04_13675 [Mesorhizobium sp.]TIM76962.1 MAG: hypothetical protein E5Y58_04710 [Mesorhizobium sp.]
MADLPSKSAVKLVLLAEQEMFGKLAAVVRDVRDNGAWRAQAANSGDLQAVENWLTEYWSDGFNDDLSLVVAWLKSFDDGDLLPVVEAERATAEQLLQKAKYDKGKLSGLAAHTLDSWIKDLDDEVKAKAAMAKNLT